MCEWLWQGLGDDSIDIICSLLGQRLTQLSLAGCTQLSSEYLMLHFHDKFPCLHTLDVYTAPTAPPPPAAAAVAWWELHCCCFDTGYVSEIDVVRAGAQIRGCSQIQQKDMALVVVARTFKGLPRIEIRS